MAGRMPQTTGELERFLRDYLRAPGSVPKRAIIDQGSRRGSTTITGTGASSATGIVTHGLGVEPALIIVTTDNGLVMASATARDEDDFTITNRTIDGSTYSSAVRNDWMAVA